MKLFLKGDRCSGPKCAFERRDYVPGQHGQRRMKLSEYGQQLQEKQRLKRMYHVLERQFRRYFRMAEKTKGVTGTVLLQLLERRLDNVVYRLGYVSSRPQARQVVRHGFLLVNDRKASIPSFSVKAGDVIRVKADERIQKQIKERLAGRKAPEMPTWIEADPEKLTAKITRLPERADIKVPIQEQMVVELYSK